MSNIISREICFEDGRKLFIEQTDGIKWLFTLFAATGKIEDLFSDNILFGREENLENKKVEPAEPNIANIMLEGGYPIAFRFPNGRAWLKANDVPEHELTRIGMHIASICFDGNISLKKLHEFDAQAKFLSQKFSKRGAS